MKKSIIFIFIVSICFSQIEIKKKKYYFYKDKEATSLNIMDLISEEEGLFKVELIMIDDVKYERIKKILVLPCELEFYLYSELSVNPLEYKICKNKVLSNNYLLINKEYPNIKIEQDKFKYIEGNFILYISGEFNEKKKSTSSVNNGLLREWHNNGELYIEYNMKNGIKDGLCKKWYNNGQLEIMYYYTSGKLDGIQKKWYSNGAQKGEWNYSNDILHGLSKEWNLSGKLKFTKVYNNGILVSKEESS